MDRSSQQTLWGFMRMDPGRVYINNNDMCRSCIKLMVWAHYEIIS